MPETLPINTDFPLSLFNDIQGNEMKKINVFDFYLLGEVINDLRRITAGKPTPSLFVWLGNAERFLGYVIENKTSTIIPFQECVPAAESLLATIKTIQNRIIVQELGSEIIQPELDLAFRFLAEFEIIFKRECADLATFFVSQKAAFSTSILIERAEKVFLDAELKRIPQQAVDDIRRSGRCIAFELPTAAGFHAFRALESVVLDYLDKLHVQHPNRNLGAYIQLLADNGADTKVVSSLRLLKDLHRNPLFHPTDNLEIGEDIGVFNLVTTTISALVKDMGNRKLYPN